MRSLVLLALLQTACGAHLHHASLAGGGRIDGVARLAVLDAAALPDERIVIAAQYSGSHRDSTDWMDGGSSGGVVACLTADGDLDWSLLVSPSDAPGHRVATTAGGTTWLLARPLVDPASHVPPADGVALTAIDSEGRVVRRVGMASLGWQAPDAVPYFLAAAPDGGVIAVAGTARTIGIVGVGPDGTDRYVRRTERAAEQPAASGLRVVGTTSGDTLWLAGAGTTLSFAEDPTYQGPIVVAVSIPAGEVRAAFPLETELRPGGWDYPSGIAVAGSQVVLARRSANRSRVTVHDPVTFAEVRTLYAVEGAEIDALAATGDDAVVAVMFQSGHHAIRYGEVEVSTRTAPPTSQAVVGVSLPLAGGPPRVVWVTHSSDDDGIGGGARAATILRRPDHHVIAGTYWGRLGIGDDDAELEGTGGTEDQCIHEDTFHTPGCDRIPWSAPTAFIARIPD